MALIKKFKSDQSEPIKNLNMIIMLFNCSLKKERRVFIDHDTEFIYFEYMKTADSNSKMKTPPWLPKKWYIHQFLP